MRWYFQNACVGIFQNGRGVEAGAAADHHRDVEQPRPAAQPTSGGSAVGQQNHHRALVAMALCMNPNLC